MTWRVMVELTAIDGTVRTHELSTGGSNTAECSAATVGLTLADGKRILAGLQHHLVQAQAEDYCRANGGSALIVGCNGRSRMSARGGWPRCSERWRSEHRDFCPADVR
jgi:hypothetical protein